MVEGKKILVVEDVELNREIVQEILEDEGMVTDSACDGKEAVEMVAAAESGEYDAILMDIQMPVMDGFEATRQIRQMEGGDGILIVAMSGSAFEEDIQRSLDAGMDGHLSKPLDADKFIRILEKHS